MKIILFILFSSFFYGCQRDARQIDFSPLSIVGGEVVAKGEYEAVVALIRNGDFHCTGVLIAKDIILTAAHCLVDVELEELSIYIGIGYNKPKDTTYVRGQYEISKMTIYPTLVHEAGLGLRNLGEYNANDVGLVFLKNEIQEISPYSLMTSLDEIKDYLYTKSLTTIVGYGYIAEEGLDQPIIKKPDYGLKRSVQIPIKSFDNHEVDIREEGKDSCYIDSGGPVIIGDKVLALVSGSNGLCAENEFPVYYSLVFDSICWIAKETGLKFDDIERNCDRNLMIDSKCGELAGPVAAKCAADLSDLIFQTQIKI